MHVAHAIATLQVKVRSNRLGSKAAAYLQENGGLQEIHIHDSSSRTRPCTKSDTRTSEEVGTHLNTMRSGQLEVYAMTAIGIITVTRSGVI